MRYPKGVWADIEECASSHWRLSELSRSGTILLEK